jgi:four helix bundle protein
MCRKSAERLPAMLRVQVLVFDILRSLAPIVRQISHHDPSLADQIRRAGASVALNLAEGRGSQGRNGKARFHNALGSLREVQAALEVAKAFEYVTGIDADLAQRIDCALAMVFGLIRA